MLQNSRALVLLSMFVVAALRVLQLTLVCFAARRTNPTFTHSSVSGPSSLRDA